jgi:Ca-activated chloride channel homolog
VTLFHFLRPWWLLLAPIAIVLWWLERRASDTTQRWRRTIDPELLRHLIVRTGTGSRIKPRDVLLAGWLTAIVATAGPTFRQEPSPFADAARPAMLVLKVTPSMLTTDLAPTRLDRARQKIADLLGLRDGAPVGLIAYSGSAHLVLPPTSDKTVVLAMAGALSPDIMPREGDALASAVALANDVLRRGAQGGSIVVLADNVARDQLEKLSAIREAPVTLFAMRPPDQASADRSLQAAADALDADFVTPTIDAADVAALARRLKYGGTAPSATGEGQRWQEAGYWLTPLIALLTLMWFRRGWLLA